MNCTFKPTFSTEVLGLKVSYEFNSSMLILEKTVFAHVFFSWWGDYWDESLQRTFFTTRPACPPHFLPARKIYPSPASYAFSFQQLSFSFFIQLILAARNKTFASTVFCKYMINPSLALPLCLYAYFFVLPTKGRFDPGILRGNSHDTTREIDLISCGERSWVRVRVWRKRWHLVFIYKSGMNKSISYSNTLLFHIHKYMSDNKEEETRIEHKHSSDDTSSSAIETGGNSNGFQQPFQKSKAEKKLLRKIDFTFLPLVICIVMVQVCMYIFGGSSVTLTTVQWTITGQWLL